MGCWYDFSISPFSRDKLDFSLDLWNFIVIMYYMQWSLYGHPYPSRCILHLYLWRVSVLAFCCYFLDLQNSLVAIDKKKEKKKKVHSPRCVDVGPLAIKKLSCFSSYL